ncbi:MAG TPA: hypothetical protein VG961_05690 [Ignavibacteria bacterium]|nr:hypothetical protein [Ignavibacteria bacterium]
MNKKFRNIICIFTAFLMLAGGNFAFALAHADCHIGTDKHITCEMECCKENPCIEDESDGSVKLVDESDSCCKTHIDQAMEQDVTLPLITNKTELSKSIFANLDQVLSNADSKGFTSIIHKHKTTNILLITSVLRI